MALIPAQMNRAGVVRQKAFYDDAARQYIPVVAIEGGASVGSSVQLAAGSNLAGKFILVANGVDVATGAPLPVTGPLTDAQLRAAGVPVTGPLTDAQIRATALPVSGPLTDAQIRATALPVSGPLTDAQLRAALVPTSQPGALGELSATLTRLSNITTYTGNGLIAPNAGAAAGNAIPMTNAVLLAGDGFRVERCWLGKSTNGAVSPNFRVFLWRAQPTFTALGDGGILGAITALVVDDITKLIDYFDVTMDRFGSTAAAGASGVGLPASGNPVLAKPASGTTLYYNLQALAGYVPGNAEVFTPRFEGQRT